MAVKYDQGDGGGGSGGSGVVLGIQPANTGLAIGFMAVLAVGGIMFGRSKRWGTVYFMFLTTLIAGTVIYQWPYLQSLFQSLSRKGGTT